MNTRRQVLVSSLIGVIFVIGFLAASAMFPGGAL